MKNIIYLAVLCFYLATACAQTSKKNEMKNDGTMQFNKLTKEEENVILYKGTELPFQVSIMISTKPEHTYADVVELNYISRTINLNRIVVGQASTMLFREL